MTNHDDLEPIAETKTEFEAQTKAAVLRAEGIDCCVVHNAPSWTGQMSLSPTARGAFVLVKRQDADQARKILKQRIDDSVDLDWDEVDVGEREDTLPLRAVKGMPILAKIAAALIALTLIAGLIVAVFVIIR
ncbi:MAG: hypothetical protein O7F76_12215 [Planctomycetota bacterium]|nr:hypothetical protein [Planctomycetota bacterium]